MNKQKIVITGGLGYIGSKVCELYSGEARYKDIIVFDQRFSADRVRQLKSWGIQYIQGSILDKDRVTDIVKNADVVIHLAGITDVAYTKTEANSEHDNLILTTAIEGTQNIIDAVNSHCKIIFPSTHVVYEGFKDTRLNITEDIDPIPVLSYSTGKVQSEFDLAISGKSYTILRFATVCGYSPDPMRINIMPNLFSKIASENGTIKLFSGGVQMKSLVALMDVARCVKFMAENDYNKEIFHLSNESMSVKEVAEICKEINPHVTLVETEDEIPNLGYTISNQKLLDTGFEFLYDVKTCIKEMINAWSDKDARPDLEYIDRGGNAYVDDRGTINNYELTEPINLIGLIDSKSGTVRANHYHPVQEQKCLLVKGQYISVIKDLSYPNAPIETRVINKGDIAIIKPNVAHTMVFTQDSMFLNLVRGEREHENYGVTHTIPYELVDENEKQKLLQIYKTSCRSCGNVHLERVVSLGASPLANSLTDSKNEKSTTYPLEMNYCPKCHNCQLSVVVPPEEMFDNYLYVSSTSKQTVQHYEKNAEAYIKEFNLNEDTLVVDIGSNDGVALKPLKDKGVKILGVEPAQNIAKIANDQGLETSNEYFTKDVVDGLINKYGQATLVTASNVFAHSDKLREIANNSFRFLKEDGTFIVEVQYLLSTIQDLTFDNIYHEHTNYWSVTSINNFFKSMGLYVYKVQNVDTHGGSIRVYIKRNDGNIDNSVSEFIKNEEQFGLTKYSTYQEFSNNIHNIKSNIRKNIDKLKLEYNCIAGYGSPAKATTALNFFGINNDDIEYIIEDNDLKFDKFVPCINIPIKDKKYCNEKLPDLVIVLAWNFFDSIVENNQHLIDQGVKFINITELQK
jgi:nucleoside-diphosphate-sugar epimerase/SAM-dependent methyltransferase/quercetin dioxygenase-like cupin family protein